jgi:cytochrome d ubiquinol oxidase subunit I
MSDIVYGRVLMGTTLSVHIIFAITGMALPLLISLAELLGIVRRDSAYTLMARRWTKALLVLFAVGAVTGTVVAFQLSLLWPSFMAIAGKVISLPFAIEGFAFILEALFLAIYVYGWDRIQRPILHWLASLPIVVASAASGMLITTVNAFMNSPAGFDLRDGQPVNIDPIAAMFNPTAFSEVSHVLVTAYLAAGVALAGMAAYALLRRRNPAPYHLRALNLGMGVAAIGAVLAILTGDSSAKAVAEYQPEKLAAMEAQFETQRRAAETIGGIVDPAHHTVHYAIQIPGFLSWLSFGDVNAPVQGLDSFAQSTWPPLMIHYTFDAMVGIGMALGALTWGYWALYLLRRRWTTHRLLLLAITLSLPLGYIAVELGWMVTELGRQPWILYHIMAVPQAFTTSPYVPQLFFLFLGIYIFVSAATIYVLVRYFHGHPLPAEIAPEPLPLPADEPAPHPQTQPQPLRPERIARLARRTATRTARALSRRVPGSPSRVHREQRQRKVTIHD